MPPIIVVYVLTVVFSPSVQQSGSILYLVCRILPRPPQPKGLVESRHLLVSSPLSSHQVPVGRHTGFDTKPYIGKRHRTGYGFACTTRFCLMGPPAKRNTLSTPPPGSQATAPHPRNRWGPTHHVANSARTTGLREYRNMVGMV